MIYNRTDAVNYAKKWAYDRNPRYYDFSLLGGDCTNFISQCLYAGSKIMNYTPVFGWYYISSSDRTASWSGVEYLYNFLTSNKGAGPYGIVLPLSYGEEGDVIQLSFDGAKFSHSLVITQKDESGNPDSILVATHTFDAYDKPLGSYVFRKARLIHIMGVRS